MNPIRWSSNRFVMTCFRLGVPLPPYTRGSAMIVETIGRRSGKRRRSPVGCLEDAARFIVVAEYGETADYVRNALAHGARLQIFHRGCWRDATLRLLDDDPEPYLARMSKAHARLVRHFGPSLRVIEITPEP